MDVHDAGVTMLETNSERWETESLIPEESWTLAASYLALIFPYSSEYWICWTKYGVPKTNRSSVTVVITSRANGILWLPWPCRRMWCFAPVQRRTQSGCPAPESEVLADQENTRFVLDP